MSIYPKLTPEENDKFYKAYKEQEYDQTSLTRKIYRDNNKEKNREYSKNYRENNKEKYREYSKTYRLKEKLNKINEKHIIIN